MTQQTNDAPVPSQELEQLVLAAETYATPYVDDPRDCIMTDVINAFYAGAAWEAKRAKAAVSDPRKFRLSREYRLNLHEFITTPRKVPYVSQTDASPVPFPMQPVHNFLRLRGQNSTWLKVGDLEIYVRKSGHILNGTSCYTFVVANVTNGGECGTGTFRRFLLGLKFTLEDYPSLRDKITAIYIENVVNERLAASLPSMGFTRTPERGWGDNTPCFYQLLDL